MVGSKEWSRSTEHPWRTRAFTVYGVRDGAKYMVRVIACNAAGEGTPGYTESVIVKNPAGLEKTFLNKTVKKMKTLF